MLPSLAGDFWQLGIGFWNSGGSIGYSPGFVGRELLLHLNPGYTLPSETSIPESDVGTDWIPVLLVSMK